MSMTDELERLSRLHETGALSDAEFADAKARVLGGANATPTPAPQVVRNTGGLNQLHRSRDDRWIAGVAGGLAELTDIPTWAWRILFVLTTFLHGIGLLMYVLLWIFVPLAKPALPAPPQSNQPAQS